MEMKLKCILQPQTSFHICPTCHKLQQLLSYGNSEGIHPLFYALWLGSLNHNLR